MATDFSRFFTQSLDLLATVGPDGYFYDLNPMWEFVLGHTVAEMTAVPFIDLVHPDDRDSTLATAAQVFGGTSDVIGFENRYRCKNGEYKWLQWVASVARDTSGVVYACARDITQHKQIVSEHERALAERDAALAQAAEFELDYRRVEEELRQRIDDAQDAMHSMSTPIIQVWDDIVTMPVVGLVDSARAGDMKNSLLETVARTGSKFAIVDLTGVDVVDTATADHLLKVMRAVGLLGARCILTGIQPSVAQIIVGLGVDMDGVVTLRSLREGLKYCLRSMGFRITRPAPAPAPTAA